MPIDPKIAATIREAIAHIKDPEERAVATILQDEIEAEIDATGDDYLTVMLRRAEGVEAYLRKEGKRVFEGEDPPVH